MPESMRPTSLRPSLLLSGFSSSLKVEGRTRHTLRASVHSGLRRPSKGADQETPGPETEYSNQIVLYSERMCSSPNHDVFQLKQVAYHLNHKFSRVMPFLVFCGNRRRRRRNRWRSLEGFKFLAWVKGPPYAHTYSGNRK